MLTDSCDILSGYIDVRDLARAHIGALNSSPESVVGRKRLLMASPHDLNFKTVIDFIAEKRPELRDRLIDRTKAPKFPVDRLILDIQRVEEVTGVKVDSYIPWQDTIVGTVDDLIKLEKDWVSKGFSVEVPPAW
jgi:nucleoside-diphosphate-sugar epimerase